ncbi:hypothetical protein SZ25_00325 [Candidatus Arcanobacter lacustris]|uniref:Uncharacterized protein n=1 Tax=Candidatus Arcanibacter lacustris TaxID=1607817 RepID=A0A0F5MR79_9RICK|nr:hypothetical protein SZ25_00325 [Candidatus Arcanobacter lacustris]
MAIPATIDLLNSLRIGSYYLIKDSYYILKQANFKLGTSLPKYSYQYKTLQHHSGFDIESLANIPDEDFEIKTHIPNAGELIAERIFINIGINLLINALITPLLSNESKDHSCSSYQDFMLPVLGKINDKTFASYLHQNLDQSIDYLLPDGIINSATHMTLGFIGEQTLFFPLRAIEGSIKTIHHATSLIMSGEYADTSSYD